MSYKRPVVWVIDHINTLLNILPSHMCTDVGYTLFMESDTNRLLYCRDRCS